MPADLTMKKNNFITRTTNGVCEVLDAIDRLRALTTEFSSLDYANPETGITDEVMAASGSQHLDRNDFLMGFQSLVAIDQFLLDPTTAHGQTLQKFRR